MDSAASMELSLKILQPKHCAKQLSVHNLEGFGFEPTDVPAIRAAGAVLTYLQETQRSGLDHFQISCTSHRRSGFLQIDAATRRSLEITRTLRSGSREGSLLGVIDLTCTPMGSRLLADWISAPLINTTGYQPASGRG